MTTHKRLRALGSSTAAKKGSETAASPSSECAICLMPIAPCQSLFVAPCSHVWHFKCIRPILNDNRSYPQFLCPNCRAVADLEADVDEPPDEWQDEEDEDDAGEINGGEREGKGHGGNATAGHGYGHGETSEQMANMAGHDANANCTNGTDGNAHLAAEAPRAPCLDSDSRNGTNDTNRHINLVHNAINQLQLQPPRHSPSPAAATGGRPYTPDLFEAFAMPEEGPLTPRNYAGPFVLDGGATQSPGNVNGVVNANGIAMVDAKGPIIDR